MLYTKEIDNIIEKLFDYFKVSTIQDLAFKMRVTQSSISNWKTRNSINAIKRKCRELGIYNEIFDSKIQIKLENKSDLSKYFIALQSVAIATNKEDDLIDDIRELIQKYMRCS